MFPPPLLLRSALVLSLALALASPSAVRAQTPIAAAASAASWKEDFSNPEAFQKAWTPYGFLATGIDAQHPLGTTVSGAKARPDWWQLRDGALLCQNFPEEKHPAGLTHAASGTNIRLRCRVKLPAGGMGQFTIRGDNPIVEKNFHIAVFRIHTDSVAAAENDVRHPKDSPEAKAMKEKGEWNRKFFIAKTEKRTIAPDVWHELVIELRGKEMTAFVDGEKALTYTTLCGDVPKTSIGLAGGHSRSGVMQTWFDDVEFSALD
ncbi:MAG: hypothetical protein RLZZ142_479 [Verrucomicrobiota bacterium]|jgi:hypothetical protein